MKKIDLHTHTVCTSSDSFFEFSINALKSYIKTTGVDCIAITNHNIFDIKQYKEICDKVDILVLPGIEVDVENGHLLVISCKSDLEKFSEESNKVSSLINRDKHSLSFEEFNQIFDSLDKRILIPHSDKKPVVPSDVISKFGKNITCGEVANPKKFIKYKKNNEYPTPVLFSDLRLDERKIEKLTSRCTYIQVGELNFDSIKLALSDKSKVHLTADEGHNLIECLGGKVKISSGLNVILGKRASGKSHLLNNLFDENSVPDESKVKYIKQFELQQIDDNKIDDEVRNADSIVIDKHLIHLKNLTEKIIEINIDANNKTIERYVDTLKKFASHTERQDAFSKTIMFSENKFQLIENSETSELLNSLITIIGSESYHQEIENIVQKAKLKDLFFEILKRHKEKTLEVELKKLSNNLIDKIKDSLYLKTSAERVSDIDPTKIVKDAIYVTKFNEVVKLARQKNTFYSEDVQGFKKIFETGPFINATDIKTTLGTKQKFTDAFTRYDSPFEFISYCKDTVNIPVSELYKCLVKVSVTVLNGNNLEISGGEKSEYMLLSKIKNSLEYDLVLIDEPESSFDNIFLNERVNSLIKDISNHVPVVLATHSATVGATVNADYYIHTQMNVGNGDPEFSVYYGHPYDLTLKRFDNKEVNTRNSLIDCFEAGEKAYALRKEKYESLKN